MEPLWAPREPSWREYAEATEAWTREASELTDAELARVLGVDCKTMQRWRDPQSAPSSTHRRRVEPLNQLRCLPNTSFRVLEAEARWLHRPASGLRDRTPIAALGEGTWTP